MCRADMRSDAFAPTHSGIRPVHSPGLGAGSGLVVLAFEQDVERGEGSVPDVRCLKSDFGLLLAD